MVGASGWFKEAELGFPQCGRQDSRRASKVPTPGT